MIENLPLALPIIFILIVIITIVWFYLASKSRTFLIIVTSWTIIQSALSINGFFQHTESNPPRLILYGVFPAIIAIITTFLTKRGRTFINKINLKTLTYFHSIRIPVEIILSLLFHYGAVSVYMTFEGTNFDIISGLSAPVIAYLAFRSTPNKKLLISWNIICLLLLLNVVITAIFAFPSPFQKLAFNQPNLAVLYFPYSLLPTLIVPIVIFSHLIAIKRLNK